MLVAKYKFDKSIYENFIPVFNDGYEGYTYTDEIDSENSNHIIRTIECDVLPTMMKFGSEENDSATDKSLSLLEIIELNTSGLTSCRRMFKNCRNLINVNTENWTLDNVTDMHTMFYYCNNLISLDVSNFNTSKVTNMANMFNHCDNLTSLDVSNFDTSKVTNMRYMFNHCDNLTSLDVSNFDTSKVTDMGDMFYSTSNLQYIRCNNVSTINTLIPVLYNRTSSTQGKIITTSSTNVDTTTLSSLNWSLDTSSGTKIAEYKFDKSIWNYLVPEFNEGYSGYFCNDRIEDEVNNPNVVTRELIGYGGLPTLMRFGRVSVEGESATDNRTDSLLEVLDMNTSGLTSCSDMFRYNKNLTSITCKWDTSKVTYMNSMFYKCNKLTSVDVSNFDTSKVTNMSHMFRGCVNLTQLDVSSWDTSNVINIGYIFYDCNKLISLDLSNWDTSNVIYMNYMFHYCFNLTTIGNVSNWNTSKVTGMTAIFYNCQKLTTLDVNNWDTGNVKYFHATFYGCKSLVSLDVSNWNTSNSILRAGMFQNCTNLTSLDVSKWNTNKEANMSSMFQGCTSLTSLDVSNFNTSNVTSMTDMFANTPLLTDIGMLYCSQDTINKVTPLITNGSKTIWVKDTKASDYTATDYVTFKDYKEDNRTLYLNSPLLEGDEIVNKEGKLYHYHKMGKVVFDGSEDERWYIVEGLEGNLYNVFGRQFKEHGQGSDTIINISCNTLMSDLVIYTYYGKTNSICLNGKNYMYISISKSIQNLEDFKQWLQENPTTVVYELKEPYYELISDDPLIVKSYAEGKLDTSSIITPTSIQSIPYEEELTYLYTSTQYCIQFNSTANCTVDITLGGTKVETKSVKIGLNKIYITTPSTLVDNKLIINAKGNATISEVVVVNSNAEFDYFDGIKSSFEDCLVTDVDNENYGKYEVGVKIVGKNKFKGWKEKIYMKSNTHYSILSDVTTGATRYNIRFYNKNNENVSKEISIKNISAQSNLYYNANGHFRTGADSTYIRNVFIIYGDFEYAKFYCDNISYLNVRLEEVSAVSIPYEPYKETNATIYLNSPLLQGDRIEVIDGKLCHYHKMGKVVLDGSENWSDRWENNKGISIYTLTLLDKGVAERKYMCDNLQTPFSGTSLNQNSINNHNQLLCHGQELYSQNIYISFNANTLDDFKQWLSENPTTVIYELAEPYYEDITPIQSSFVISTVSEGDMEIITDLPIKSNITYLTNITSAVLMEQQLDELDNGTESLTNIVEDEINE